MSHNPTRDPIDELRGANPLHDDQLPPNSRDRLWSQIQEARMSDNLPQTDSGHTRFARWTIAASGAALVAVVAAALTIGGTAAPPQTGNEGTGGGGGIMMCLAFTIEDLQARDFAFDGTVTAVSGNLATFTVNDGFWGVEDGASVTLQADLMVGEPDVVALEGGPLLVVGDRYLVSGDEDFAWSCGYTQVYDEATAAEWAAAAP
jgi:hypothetical protein